MNKHSLSKTKSAAIGLTLLELLIVVVILGLLASVASIGLRSLWQSQLLTANLDVIRNWLESTRRAALRGESCEIQILINGNVSDGTDIIESKNAGTLDQSCNNPRKLQLESPSRKSSYNFSVTSGTAVSSFFLTPRGTVFNPSSNGPTFTSDIVFRLEFADKSGKSVSDAYCLRMSPLMANISQPSKSNC